MSDLSASDSAEATRVLQAFMDAGTRHDEEAMRACVTRATVESGSMNASGGPEGMRFVLDEQHREGDVVVIRARAFPLDAPEGAEPALEMACLMVQEDGQWKLDLMATMERMLGGNLDEAMGQMADGLSQAMEGVGEAIGEGFRQAFGEEPAQLDEDQKWDDASLTPSGEELQGLPALSDLPKTQAALSDAVGSPVLMQAMMTELLQQTSADEPEELANWFEDQLFAGWAAMLSEVAQQGIVLKNRLRAVRIEAVNQVESRLLVLDGSDLVYRMRLPFQGGFFQDDEVRAMLPGVLAGLPETIEESVSGYRLIANEDEYPDLDLYRRHVAPRLMRRIGEAAGRHVALGINWSEMSDATQSGATLSLWGLQRVLGGIVLACLDPARRQALNAGLARIRIVLNHEVVQRYARYEDGTLEVGLGFYGGAKTGPYEYEIAQALAGSPVE